jgi:hypothetical protein
MRILRPKGTPIELEGEQFNLLFTVDVIDDIQEHFDNDIVSVLNSMREDSRKGYKVIAYVLMTLINAALERDGLEDRYNLKRISQYITNNTARELIPLIIYTFNNDAPPSEEKDPNGMSGQQKK